MHAPKAVFIGDNFLLDNETARELFHEHARDLPIVDFHTHILPEQVYRNQRFENLTQLWLDEDRGKWRLMRQHGVHEALCSGAASDYDKFVAWAETLPKLIGSPMYHWSHMELARTFGLDHLLINAATADEIWRHCDAQLGEEAFAARALLERARILLICTTDDPTDSLEYHRVAAQDPTLKLQMRPTWRPDRAYTIDDVPAFNAWVDALAAAADLEINDLDHYLQALQQRHDFFAEHGCQLSDRGLDHLRAKTFTRSEAATAFDRLRSGKVLTPDAAAAFQSFMLHELAVLDHAKGWTQQIHLGALRDANTRLRREVGLDMGADSIGDYPQAAALAGFLDRLDRTEQLPRTIIYNLNPSDYDLIATMAGNFPDSTAPAKIQLGSAWWFNDHEQGLTTQLQVLARYGMLSSFVGMVTDSRSLLSYVRHEYFRRVLCNLLGSDVERGRLPNDMKLLGELVADLCYRNAVRYLQFDLDQPLAQSSLAAEDVTPAKTPAAKDLAAMPRKP